MKIYLASSWRNANQPQVLDVLRRAGHAVYDFRHPEPGSEGFSWRLIDEGSGNWTAERFREALKHPAAQHGFHLDMQALAECDACVLLLPCGRSAHLELGWATGAGKRTIVFIDKYDEPELMYLMCDRIAVDLLEVIEILAGWTTLKAAQEPVCPRCKGTKLVGPWGDSDRDVDDLTTCPDCRFPKRKGLYAEVTNAITLAQEADRAAHKAWERVVAAEQAFVDDLPHGVERDAAVRGTGLAGAWADVLKGRKHVTTS